MRRSFPRFRIWTTRAPGTARRVATHLAAAALTAGVLAGCAGISGTGSSAGSTTSGQVVSSSTTMGSATSTSASNLSTSSTTGGEVTTSMSTPQIGVNFIRFYWSEGHAEGQRHGRDDRNVQDFTLPEKVFADFAELGVQAYRQFINADLLWDVVEPEDDDWHFERADAVIMNSPAEPVVTLFALQYASPTPPWADEDDSFQSTLGPEALDYLTTVVTRYAPYVRYWELGNEMDHWRAVDPGSALPAAAAEQLPACRPADGFSPQEQGAFLAEVAALVRQLDPDAVIVLPGMSGLDEYHLSEWLPGVIEGAGGSEWFDVVGYHSYSSWFRAVKERMGLTQALARLELDGKPVWLTETGSSSSFTLSLRTNYPNSAQSQAADVFRRLLPAYATGDALVLWHTYIGSPDSPDNSWRCYGLRDNRGRNSASYYAFKLFTSELLPLDRVEAVLAESLSGRNVYRVATRAGAVRYVAWGMGTWEVPSGVSEVASTVPDSSGTFRWRSVSAGETVMLGDVPVILR